MMQPLHYKNVSIRLGKNSLIQMCAVVSTFCGASGPFVNRLSNLEAAVKNKIAMLPKNAKYCYVNCNALIRSAINLW